MKIEQELKKLGSAEKAKNSQWFFKTGKGEYAEGDTFIGVTVPNIRKTMKKYRETPLQDVKRLLQSSIHEYRLAALLLLVWQFEHSDEKARTKIYKLYLQNTKHINNWDLVDSSAPQIIGGYLEDKKDRKILHKLAHSKDLWEQRIAMLATYQFIKNDDFQDALQIAKLLLHHEHDLIHKAVGWMLREVGNRDRKTEEKFLKVHYKAMPRTMLRYAIEKFPESRRQAYLKGKI